MMLQWAGHLAHERNNKCVIILVGEPFAKYLLVTSM